MEARTPPTLYEWAGGMPAIKRWMDTFYANVRADPALGPVFAGMKSEHPTWVAEFVAEVLGGPDAYSCTRGGHPHMVRAHLERRLTPSLRKRGLSLLLDSADAAGLPDDPEFRSALVAYFEWGSRIAVINSQPGAKVDPGAPMPRWGWGVPGGPYRPPS
jgi:hemoglobin